MINVANAPYRKGASPQQSVNVLHNLVKICKQAGITSLTISDLEQILEAVTYQQDQLSKG